MGGGGRLMKGEGGGEGGGVVAGGGACRMGEVYLIDSYNQGRGRSQQRGIKAADWTANRGLRNDTYYRMGGVKR